MDRTLDIWRQFFKAANTNIFTLVENAISVAASDCPQELKVRRDKITERLFTGSFVRCGGCHGQNFAGRDTLAADNRIKGKVLLTAPDRERAKVSCNDSLHSNATCIRNVNKNETTLSNVKHDEIKALHSIKEIISNPNESPNKLYECLRRLELMDVSLDTLEVTGIGRVVNALKRHPSTEVQIKAKFLVRNWKALVGEWIKARGDPAAASAENSTKLVTQEIRKHEAGLPMPPLDEGAFTAHPVPIEMSKFFEGVDEDGNLQSLNEQKRDGDITRTTCRMRIQERVVNDKARGGPLAENVLKTDRKICIRKNKDSGNVHATRLSRGQHVPPRPARNSSGSHQQIKDGRDTQCAPAERNKAIKRNRLAAHLPSSHNSELRNELSRMARNSYEKERNGKRQRAIQ